jgi:hypothetical protein
MGDIVIGLAEHDRSRGRASTRLEPEVYALIPEVALLHPDNERSVIGQITPVEA